MQVDALGLRATETLTVELRRVVIVEGAPADAAARFDGATVATADLPAREANLLYPLEGAVFPQNVFPADVQWERGVEGDLFRVRLTSPVVSVTAYLAHGGAGFRYDWLVRSDVWRALAEATPETAITLQVDRLEAGGSLRPHAAQLPLRRRVDLAEASTTGIPERAHLTASPATGAWRVVHAEPAGTAQRRTSLRGLPHRQPRRHAHGRGALGRRRLRRRHLRSTADPSGDPRRRSRPRRAAIPHRELRPTTRAWSRTTASSSSQGRNSGAKRLPAGGAVFRHRLAHPTWSPDGTQIAAPQPRRIRVADFRRSDLAPSMSRRRGHLAAPRVIFRAQVMRCARPGRRARRSSRFNTATTAAFAKTSAARRCHVRGLRSAATKHGEEPRDLERRRREQLRPDLHLDEGGYLWLAFVSTRDYERRRARVSGVASFGSPRFATRRPAGADPSLVPYWLPQQSLTEENMAVLTSGRVARWVAPATGDCCLASAATPARVRSGVPPDDVECSEMGRPAARATIAAKARAIVWRRFVRRRDDAGELRETVGPCVRTEPMNRRRPVLRR
ncbi:MAG: hypothetical protein R3B99_29095 [Polyangiales bacterium]